MLVGGAVGAAGGAAEGLVGVGEALMRRNSEKDGSSVVRMPSSS